MRSLARLPGCAVLPLFVLAGCAGAVPTVTPGSAVVDLCPARGPQTALGEVVTAKQFAVVGDAASALSTLGAPQLWCGTGGDSIRVSTTRSRRPTVIVTLRRARTWEVGRQATNDPRRPEADQGAKSGREVVTQVPDDLADELYQSLSASGFWTAEAGRRADVQDGGGWVLEARQGARYWATVRDNVADEALDPIVTRLLAFANPSGSTSQ